MLEIAFQFVTRDKCKLAANLRRLADLIEQDDMHAMAVAQRRGGDPKNLTVQFDDPLAFDPVKHELLIRYSKDAAWVGLDATIPPAI